MLHIMQDIETWSTRNNALLISIGAVKFDKDNIIDRFEVGIDPVDAARYGLHIDPETVQWWMHPDRREALDRWQALPKVDLAAALDGFSQWVRFDTDELGSLWGNGATFDNVKLKSAFDAVGLEYPVSFRQDECYRTMKNRFPTVEFVRVGVSHSPLDDAMSQALHLQEIARQFGVTL